MSNIPASVPQIKREDLIAKIEKAYPGYVLPDFCVVGIRGYYKDTMGKVGINDRLIYDDAIMLLTKSTLINFNANVDPGAFRKGIATLKAGIWPVYKFAIHGGKIAQYPAICQRAGNVTVTRDGGEETTGNFGINIHRGGVNSVSSEGCQTIPPIQWNDFINTAYTLAKSAFGTDYATHVLTYILLENE